MLVNYVQPGHCTSWWGWRAFSWLLQVKMGLHGVWSSLAACQMGFLHNRNCSIWLSQGSMKCSYSGPAIHIRIFHQVLHMVWREGFYPVVRFHVEHDDISPDKCHECEVPVGCQFPISCVDTLMWPWDSLPDESGTHPLHARFQGLSFSLSYRTLLIWTGSVTHGLYCQVSSPQTLFQPLSGPLIYGEFLNMRVQWCGLPPLGWLVLGASSQWWATAAWALTLWERATIIFIMLSSREAKSWGNQKATHHQQKVALGLLNPVPDVQLETKPFWLPSYVASREKESLPWLFST